MIAYTRPAAPLWKCLAYRHQIKSIAGDQHINSLALIVIIGVRQALECVLGAAAAGSFGEFIIVALNAGPSANSKRHIDVLYIYLQSDVICRALFEMSARFK